MTFDNHQSLISNSENWSAFEPVFGGTRPRTSGKSKQISEIRNDERRKTRQSPQSRASNIQEHNADGGESGDLRSRDLDFHIRTDVPRYRTRHQAWLDAIHRAA
jgi:hypothetical protein